MDVDMTDPSIDELLVKAGLRLITVSPPHEFPTVSILACRSCQHGITPKSAMEHINGHHIPFSKKERSTLINYFTHCRLPGTAEKIFPSSPTSPYEGL